MCDEYTVIEDEEYLAKRGITRRDFGKIGVGVSLIAMLPPVANAQDVSEREVEIETPDGMADGYFVHPSAGRHPAIIMWPDVLSIRPTYRLMAKRLAQSGYSVFLANPYYRTYKGRIAPEGAAYSDPEVRAQVTPHRNSLSAETAVIDGIAYVSWLDQQDSVDTSRKVGSAGYCMTGSYTFRLAAALPGRVGAGASFHGGGLASDNANSPHFLIPQMQAGMLVAIAQNDDERGPEAKEILRESFDAAGVSAEIEVYPANHGWTHADSSVYDEEQAERAWARMLELFETNLS
jgi:carboxymethylenebutenolidase